MEPLPAYSCPPQHCYTVAPKPRSPLPDLRPAHARRSRADAFARNARPTRSKKAGSNKPPARVW